MFKPLVKDCLQIHIGADSEIPQGWTKCDGRSPVNGKTIPNLTNRFIYINNNSSSSYGNSDNQPVTGAGFNIGNAVHTHKSRDAFNTNVGTSGNHNHTGNVTMSLNYSYTYSSSGVSGYVAFGANNNMYTTTATSNSLEYTSNAISANQNSNGVHSHTYSSSNLGTTGEDIHSHNIEGTKSNTTRPYRMEVCFIIWTGL